MRYFNTSGPNIPEQHYTLRRPDLIAQGLDLVQKDRYFTIWAPRQTGKSTYFMLLKTELEKRGFQVIHFNVENYKGETLQGFLDKLQSLLLHKGISAPPFDTLARFSNYLETVNDRRLVMIIDEIENLNPDLFGDFLHTIRSLYHSRATHCLKSVILVGVSNIVGVISDNASPFNVADTLNVPYFTDRETAELLHQHETETGQLFDKKVVRQISRITANQPGLVNGFAFQLVQRNPGKRKITYNDYLTTEHWYLNVAIDKNFENILNKAKKYRAFLETLLFTDVEIPFNIDREAIKVLHTNGILRESKSGKVEFWVPFYKKRLMNAFYPYTNGEKDHIVSEMLPSAFFTPFGQLDIPKLMAAYQEYVARRGFGAFREKDENGKFINSVKEAALIHSFETFLYAFVSAAEGKSYREADAALGKSDLVIHVRGQECLFETKKYYGLAKFNNGKKQLSYYARSLGLKRAVYVVFMPDHLTAAPEVRNDTVTEKGVEVSVYVIRYNEEKDFKKKGRMR